MFLPSHIASGYLLGKWMKTSPWTVYPFMPVLLLASILPDMDGLFSTTVAGHHSVLHTPIFWIGLFVLMATEGIISKNDKKKIHCTCIIIRDTSSSCHRLDNSKNGWNTMDVSLIL